MHIPLNGNFNILVSVLNCNEKALIAWFPVKFIKKSVSRKSSNLVHEAELSLSNFSHFF